MKRTSKKGRVISHLQINAWDIVYGLWIGQSRQVSGLQAPGPMAIMARRMILPDTGLGDVLHEVGPCRLSDRAQCLADMDGDLFRELGRLSNAISENDECYDLLALRKS